MTLLLLISLMVEVPVTVIRCSVVSDPHQRIYELQRSGEGEGARWTLTMRSREAGAAPVLLPLPDAAPTISDRQAALEYRTLNGGRTVKLNVDEKGSGTLDVYTNFELEVNVEPDMDPRVELMNTEGPISNLSCSIAPKP